MPRAEIQVHVDVTPFFMGDLREESIIHVSTELVFEVGQARPERVRAELHRLAESAAAQYEARVSGPRQADPEGEGGDAGSGA